MSLIPVHPRAIGFHWIGRHELRREFPRIVAATPYLLAEGDDQIR